MPKMSFRGKETNGWRIVSSPSSKGLETILNNLMKIYEFEDLQFSVDSSGYHEGGYHAAVLLGKEREEREEYKLTDERRDKILKTFERMRNK